MNPQFLSIALFTLYLPHFIAASKCPSCESYNAALKSCTTTGIDSTAIGNKMDTDTVHCMCVSRFSATEMIDCLECNESVDEAGVDSNALSGWYYTCTTDETWGDQQAVACWEGLSGNLFYDDTGECNGNTIGKGSAITSSGPDLVVSSVSSLIASMYSETPSPHGTISPSATTSPSRTTIRPITTTRPGSTTQPTTTALSETPIRPTAPASSTTTAPSTETNPSPKANSKSVATMSSRSIGLFSTIFIGLGVLLPTQ